MPTQTEIMEKIVALCRRRGFIFGSSEIYGGIGGFWDYGPLGCELKRNIKDVWWNDMVRNPPPGPNGVEYQMVGVDCSIIMNPKVWEASGHVGGFKDPMISCKTEGCKRLFRADKVYAISIMPPEYFGAEVGAQLHERGWAQHTALRGDILTGKRYYVLSAEADSFAEAVDRTPAAVREFAKRRNIRELKSFELRTPTRNLWDVLLGKDSTGTEFACGFNRLDSGWFNVDTPCPACFGEITPPREFNLMFESHAGAVRDDFSKVYLRPETAQGIFANFKNVMDSTRVKIPFGIAQVGKAFRNEINPRNFTFRSREFEQMEIEFFCHPDESRMWYEYWRDVRIKWYESLNIRSEKLRPREQGKEELAHYSCGTTDVEYLFPFSDQPQELEGVAHRGDFDLKAHGKHARNDEMAFAVVDESEPRSSDRADSRNSTTSPASESPRGLKSAARYVPHVIEPSAGADRFTLAVICEAYSYDESRASPEFLKIHPRLAPVKAAVFPLVAKDGLPEIAEPIYREIKKHYPCQYDAKQSIGKRYARMDEAGTPFCFTIDGQTKEDGTVTVRNRDDATQIRIDKSRCLEYLRENKGL